MSGLDAGQITLATVWIHNGVAENKGGVDWGVGDDGTGTGTPTLPYASLLQALKEVRIVEGQKDVTRDWEFRFITDDDESDNYGDTIFGDDATLPDIAFTHIAIYSGWLKSWGAIFRGKWATIDERPPIGRVEKTTAGSLGGNLVRTILKDLAWNTGAVGEAFKIKTDGTSFISTPAAIGFVQGCIFDGDLGSGLLPILYSGDIVAGTTSGQVACFYKRKANMTIALNGTNPSSVITTHAVNITVIPRFEESGLTGNRTPSKIKAPRLLNCLIAADGVGSFTLENTGSSSTLDAIMIRHHCRYWRRGSASFFRRATGGGSDLVAFSAVGGQDDESSEGDPLVSSPSNPLILDTSPSLDKGGAHGVSWDKAIDPSGNNFHQLDILGFEWGDSVDLNTPSTADGLSIFSHRAIGCHQNLLGVIPDPIDIVWPVGIIQVDTSFVVSPVPTDNDLLGTVQMRLFQADDAGLTTNLVIKDSVPLLVDASNNKINFKEDGGGELTATLVNGIYSTQELMAVIKTALEAAGAGDYDVTYNSSTELVTITATAGITNVQLLFQTGTDVANSTRTLIGYLPLDTANQPSLVGDDALLENFYDSSLTWELSDSTYISGLDPEVSGSWSAMGTGIPSDAGVEGVDGVEAIPAQIRFVRVNLGLTDPLPLKYHAVQFWNGKLKSQNDVI